MYISATAVEYLIFLLQEQSGDHVFEGEDLPSMSGSHDHLDSPTTVMMVDVGLDTEEPIEDDVKELQDGNFYHPDFINLDDDSCSGTFAIN